MALVNTLQQLEVFADEMEVRKVEVEETEVSGKLYKKLRVHFDDVNGDRFVAIDKDVSHEENYKRGTIGRLTLSLIYETATKESKTGRTYVTDQAKVFITNFEPKKGAK